jgi:hypothetical protein
MKAIDAIVVWTPQDRQNAALPGSIRIEKRGTHWDRTPGDFWGPATSLGSFGQIPTKGDKIKQLLAMFILFNTVTVRDGISVEDAHNAFLQIDEYRKTISPDAPGAEQ